MRAPLLVLFVLVAGLSGCVAPSGVPSDPPAAPPAHGYVLECGIATATPWPEPCLAWASPNDSPSKTEVDLMANPIDPLNVVVGSKDLDPKASDCVWAVAQVSKDGGRSWTTSILGGEVDSRQPGEPLWGWRCITDPIMAFDAEGVLYYSLQAYDHTLRDNQVPEPAPLPLGPTFGSSILMARSLDGGLTWDRILTLHVGDGTSVFHDYMRMAVNPATGSVYTIWNQFTQPATVIPVLVASRDGGQTAAPPVYIPVPEEATGGVVMSGLAVANDGTVYVLLNDGADGYLATSTDDARTFSAPVKVLTHTPVPRMMKNNSYRSGSGFELAVDASGGAREGWVYATYADYANEDANVFVVRSEDKGKTWSQPVLVSHGPNQRGDQWMDRPYVDRLGNLHVLYFDRSYDDANYGLDLTWALSLDGGQTFENTRLTAHSFDGGLGIHQDGFPFIGDYNGIWGAGEFVYMGFPTTATGKAEVAVARVRLPEG